jgi:hypothetical protein
MYYTGIDPFTKKEVTVAKGMTDRREISYTKPARIEGISWGSKCKRTLRHQRAASQPAPVPKRRFTNA